MISLKTKDDIYDVPMLDEISVEWLALE